jgi:4-hydroxy-tetrahydrodipicolinate synthase
MIKGSIVALVTPMHENGDIDWRSLESLVQWHIDSGTAAIVAVGTTGESATLSVKEHTQVIEKTVGFAAGRVPIIAGTGANSTSEAIELTQNAKNVGADASLLVTPYYNKPTQEGLYRHYCKIAESVDIPQILYNVPGRTACDMLPETIVRLASVSPVCGVKEATGELGRLPKIKDGVSEGFAIYSGDDGTACDFILQGGHGDISVTANVVPEKMAKMCEAALQKNEQEARQLDQKIADLHELLFVESSPIPVKWALQQMEKMEGGIRLPLTPLSEGSQSKLRQALIDSECIVNI